jgi:nucleotide-binding universal stress UspA family protein
MKRILIAVDGSDGGAEAVSAGLELASEQGAQVTFLRVYPAPEAVALTPGFTEFPMELSAIEVPPAGEDPVLADAAATAGKRGVAADLRITSGDPAWEIVAVGDELPADLIVIGSRRLGTVSGVLLGSVSNTVLRHAKRPVLIVHPPSP